MKVIVCIKQVPDTKGGVQFNPDGTLNRAAMLTIMNPDDKAGLEAALRLKDQYGAEVTVLTMGLPKAADVLQEAIAMGADKGVLVTDRVLGGADTWATSTTIAGALRKLDYDLIITGRQAIDGDTAQVGPQIAEHLGIPVISYAQAIKIDGDSVEVTKKGVVSTKMRFTMGSKNMTYYQTPYGNMSLGIITKSLEIERTEDTISIYLVYGMEVNCEHLSDCDMQITITTRELRIDE